MLRLFTSPYSKASPIIDTTIKKDNVSLTKILCHRKFVNEFAFTHSKDYLY